MASAIRCSSVASWSGTSSCALRSHNKVDVTVKNLQQRHELVDGLTVVRLIHEPIELGRGSPERSEEHTSELQSLAYLVCRLLLEKKKKEYTAISTNESNYTSH